MYFSQPPAPTPDGPPEEDVEAQVGQAVRLMVHYVASRAVALESIDLLRELEDYQQRCWARDERRFQQLRHQLQPSLASAADASAGAPQPAAHPPGGHQSSTRGVVRGSSAVREVWNGAQAGALRPRRKPTKSGRGATQVDAEISALHSRMQPLDMRELSAQGSSCGTTNAASAPASVEAPQQATSIGQLARLDCSSLVEALLPSAPPRPQFVAELENPMLSHTESLGDRLLQRRLCTLSNQQQDTIKLERKQRQESSSMSYAPAPVSASSKGRAPFVAAGPFRY